MTQKSTVYLRQFTCCLSYFNVTQPGLRNAGCWMSEQTKVPRSVTLGNSSQTAARVQMDESHAIQPKINMPVTNMLYMYTHENHEATISRWNIPPTAGRLLVSHSTDKSRFDGIFSFAMWNRKVNVFDNTLRLYKSCSRSDKLYILHVSCWRLVVRLRIKHVKISIYCFSSIL